MFIKPTDDSFPGIWTMSPGAKRANNAADMIGAAQSCILNQKTRKRIERRLKFMCTSIESLDTIQVGPSVLLL